MPLKKKYCCVCGNKGHIAETCNSPYRISQTPINSVFVSEYRQLYPLQQKSTGPDYTILTSNVNNYSFDFGNDVFENGNGIYARFKRAVNIPAQSNQRQNDNMPSKSIQIEPPTQSQNKQNDSQSAEVQEVNDEEWEVVDEIASSDHISIDEDEKHSAIDSTTTNEENYTIIDSTGSTENLNADTLIEYDNISTTEMTQYTDEHVENMNSVDADNVTAEDANIISTTNETEKELKQLDDKAKLLDDLKEIIVANSQNQVLNDSNKTSVESSSTATSMHISHEVEGDSNYSFSEFYKPSLPESSTFSDVLPDFIPLTSNEPEKFQPTRSPTPPEKVEYDNCNAKIYLSDDNVKFLDSQDGVHFIRFSTEKFNINVMIRKSSAGKVLCVSGLPEDQEAFHKELVKFFGISQKKATSTASLPINIPRNREALIRHIRAHLIQLDNFTDRKAVYVISYYNKMRRFEDFKSKAMVKKAAAFRRQVNFILFGKYGFADGRTHLLALEDHLRDLLQSTEEAITQPLRKKINEHFSYMFSPFDHRNYDIMIQKYRQLRKQNLLPTVTLDRKLLGLKINVRTNTININTVPDPNFCPIRFEKAELEDVDGLNEKPKTTTHTRKLNVMPSSIDIQINVSAPPSYQNDSGYTASNEVPHKNGILSKWKY